MVDKLSRREEFIDVTMQLIAEEGFGGFSMKQVTHKMGVSEALLYKYFESKDVLLYACFESMHRRVAALFSNYELPPLDDLGAVFCAVKGLWMKYFDFLVKSGYRTIYYFAYRDSPYINTVLKHDDEAAATYFKSFGMLMHAVNQKLHFTEKFTSAHLWTYVLDTTGIFAKRVIRGELPSTPESFEAIFTLVSRGYSSLFV